MALQRRSGDRQGSQNLRLTSSVAPAAPGYSYSFHTASVLHSAVSSPIDGIGLRAHPVNVESFERIVLHRFDHCFDERLAGVFRADEFGEWS